VIPFFFLLRASPLIVKRLRLMAGPFKVPAFPFFRERSLGVPITLLEISLELLPLDAPLGGFFFRLPFDSSILLVRAHRKSTFELSFY